MTGPESPSSAAEKAREDFVRPFEEELARLHRLDEFLLRSRLASTATQEDAHRQSLDYSAAERARLQQRPLAVAKSRPLKMSCDEWTAFAADVPVAASATDNAAAGAWLVATGPGCGLGKTHGCQSPPTQQPWQASSPIQQPWQPSSPTRPWHASSPTAAEAVTSVRERASLPTQPPCAATALEAPLGPETLNDVIAVTDDRAVRASSLGGSETSTSRAAAGSARAPERERVGRRPRSGGGGAASRLRVSLHELEREYDELLARKRKLELEIAELEGRTETCREPAGPQQQQQLDIWIVADSPPARRSADALPPEQEPAAADSLQATAMDCVNWDVLSP